MRWWLLVTVAVVALTACTDAAILDPDLGDETETAGSTALFCRAWPETRRILIATFEGEERRLEEYHSAAALDESMEEYDRNVPAGIRGHWDVAYDAYTRVSDLMFTVGPAARADHVEMVFGPAGPDAVFARAMVGIEAIDEWSITACGDFCSRWPELEDAVMLDGNRYTIHGGPEEVDRSIGHMEASIRVGNLLVPPALADEWGKAAAIKSDFLDMYRKYGREAFHEQDGEEFFRDHMGMYPEEAFEASMTLAESVGAWVDDNCTSVASAGGAPGTLSVRIRPHEDLMGRTVLLALLPIGTGVEEVEDLTGSLGLWCTQRQESVEEFEREITRQARESGRSSEEIADEWFRPEPLRPVEHTTGEYHVGSVCHLIRHEEELVMPGGSYELFAGTFIGEPGSFDLYFAAPERCAQATVAVNGDTVVDMPTLEECDLESTGRPEEIARRTAVPFEPGGTLRVELPSAFGPEEFAGCDLSAVLLPVGTTLNDIGRGDVWPFAGLQMGLPTMRHIDDPAAVRVGSESGLVPILAVGSTGSPSRLHLQVEGNRSWDASFPDPIPLAAGSYDLRLQEWCYRDEHVDDPDNEHTRCASITVEVDGDTVVKAPEFGACR
ncbi:MAG: hypothetical protein U9N79_00650 [Actinomycetota bacterium]|nr:hypothetical protein [Actinomycetota bacterium]